MPPQKTIKESKRTLGHGASSWTDPRHPASEQIHLPHRPAPTGSLEKETSFLRRVMRYDQTEECYGLEANLTRAEHNERCARRAVWLMAVLTALAVVGLGHSAILLEEFPQNKTPLMIRIFCALGLASFISWMTFVGFWLVSRGKLNVQREKCRRLATRILESRLGKPNGVALSEGVRTRSPDRPVAAEAPQTSNGESP